MSSCTSCYHNNVSIISACCAYASIYRQYIDTYLSYVDAIDTLTGMFKKGSCLDTFFKYVHGMDMYKEVIKKDLEVLVYGE